MTVSKVENKGKRNTVYLEANKKHPERWSGNARNGCLPTTVSLNPGKKKNMEQDEVLKAA